MTQTLFLDAIWWQNETWAIFRTLFTSFIASYIAFRFLMWQKRKENTLQVDKDKNALVLKSLQECWRLLQYMSPQENEKSVMTFEREKGTKNDTYFFHKSNAEAFIKALNDYFYGSGLGLFLPKEIKPFLFKYRSDVFGVLLKERNNEASKIKIENIKLYETCTKTYESINEALRKATDMQNPNLPE
jgi:hypothetical protein